MQRALGKIENKISLYSFRNYIIVNAFIIGVKIKTVKRSLTAKRNVFHYFITIVFLIFSMDRVRPVVLRNVL